MTERETIRAQRQATRDRRIAALEAKAEKLHAAAVRIRSGLPDDYAYWSQPIAPRGRKRNQARLAKSDALFNEARELREQAAHLRARKIRVAGDAQAEKDAIVAASDFKVGDVVRTIYGDRKVIKVNRKTIIIPGCFGPIKVEKHLARKVEDRP
jgi:hypothetical protein